MFDDVFDVHDGRWRRFRGAGLDAEGPPRDVGAAPVAGGTVDEVRVERPSALAARPALDLHGPAQHVLGARHAARREEGS